VRGAVLPQIRLADGLVDADGDSPTNRKIINPRPEKGTTPPCAATNSYAGLHMAMQR
jgi:hypothetical protein